MDTTYTCPPLSLLNLKELTMEFITLILIILNTYLLYRVTKVVLVLDEMIADSTAFSVDSELKDKKWKI